MEREKASVPVLFEQYATSVLAEHPKLRPEWMTISRGRGRRLRIPKQNAKGFDVIADAETYGLYPFADGWHGSAWDVIDSDQTLAVCSDFMRFILTLLSEDARLEVHYAAERPFRWVLVYRTEGGVESEATYSLLFNYFGRRSKQVHQNHHLPSRYERDSPSNW